MRLIYFILLTTPIIPKIKIVEGVYIYPVEIILVGYCLLLVYRGKLPILIYQSRATRYLFYYWTVIVFFTIVNFPFYPNLADLLRSIKGLVYIPAIFIGFKFRKTLLRDMLAAGVISLSLNYIYYLTTIYPQYGLEIWQPEALFAGMSNKYLDVLTMSLGLIPKGAHGIYGDYLVLLIAVVLFLSSRGQLKYPFALILLLFLNVSILFTVSRASLVTSISYWFLVILVYLAYKNIRLKKLLFLLALILIIGGFLMFTYFHIEINQLPLIQKLVYTINSINLKGSESNIQLRIGAWLTAFLGIIENPFRLIVGCGYNFSCIADYMTKASKMYYIDTMVPIPESLFVLALQFGGLLGLALLLLFIWEIIFLGFRNRRITYSRLFGLLFIAMLPANIFSGAPLIADLLYGQILMLIGYLHGSEDQLKQK